jgi:tetratricopeptide (TPR) repeat protein
MLFDLRGRGRRRTVQVIYLSLAILMGGGLILFGIGGATSGGLVDAITGSSDTKTDTSVYEKKIERLEKQLRLNPKNEQALAELARAQVQQASIVGYDQNTGTYDKEGIEGLQAAGQTWERYLDLEPAKPDGGLASLMVASYSSSALNDPQQAARALDVVIDARGGSGALYSQLAVLQYAAGNVRRSVIAERQALKRTPPQRRKLQKARIASQRKQIDRAKLGSATGAGDEDLEITPNTGTTTSKSK